MQRAGVIAVAVLALFGACASSPRDPTVFNRYRACVVDKSGQQMFRTGWVVAKREDGALRFQFDDNQAGDHGFLWVTDDDPYRRVTPMCKAASLFDMTAEHGGLQP